MRERDIETYLCRRVVELEGICLKLEGSYRGKPDRLVLMPGGRLAFVELKAPTGRLSAHQNQFKHHLADLGFSWGVCSSKERVDDLIEILQNPSAQGEKED